MRAWLVIAIVLAACGAKDDGAKIEIARVRAKQIANEWYPRWALKQPATPCPKSVEELATSLGLTAQDAVDPWGNAYVLACDPKPVATSGGPDGKAGTPDDVDSK
jgi:hypothetical protein